MIKKYLFYIAYFVLLTFFQITLFNKVDLFGYANPYIYILFILILPIHINRLLLILLGFISGSIIDVFANSMGVHAASATLIAFLRPFIIKQISTKQDLETKYSPTVHEMKWRWFILYSFILTFIHHTLLYVMESFRGIDVVNLFYRITINSIITLVMIFIVILLFKSNGGIKKYK